MRERQSQNSGDLGSALALFGYLCLLYIVFALFPPFIWLAFCRLERFGMGVCVSVHRTVAMAMLSPCSGLEIKTIDQRNSLC